MKNNYIRLLFFAIVGVLISVSFVTYQNLTSYMGTVASIRHSNLILLTVQNVMSSVRDAETGHRGYQLTRDTLYLAPYYHALKELPQNLRTLDSLTQADEEQRSKVDTLGQLINDQFALINQILSNASRSSLYMDQYESMLLKRGKINMDNIRAVCGSIEKKEQMKFGVGVSKETVLRENAPINLLAYNLVALIGMAYLFFSVLESLNKKRIAEEKLHDNLSELKKEVVIREFTQKTLRSVLDNSLDGIMAFRSVRSSAGTIEDFEWITANTASLVSIGKREEDVIGKRLLQLMPGNKEDGLFDVYCGVVETGQSRQMEKLYQHEGLNSWFFITTVKLEDGFVVTFSDITAQKQQQLQIEERGLLLREAETLANMGSWRWYESQDQLIWSDGLYKIWGIHPNGTDPSWQSFLKQVHPEDKEKVGSFLSMVKSRKQGADINYRVEIKGEVRHVVMAVKPREDDSSKFTDVVGTVIDITSQKLYEHQLKQFTEELQRSNQDLEQFAYVASHDLQEPLRKIRAFGDRLVSKYQEKLEGSGVDYIQRMQGASARMQLLIEDLLAFSRVSRAGVFFETLDLNQVVEEVMDDLEAQIRREEGEVMFSNLLRVKGERTQIKRLFQNLISNAIKFHKPGERPLVQITSLIIPAKEVTQIVGSPVQDKNYIKITVKDNGIGFDEKYSEKIFDIFQRLHGRMEYEGTGIGLAICRKIVTNHSGYITVVSKEGEGSEFMVILPIT